MTLTGDDVPSLLDASHVVMSTAMGLMSILMN